MSSSALKAFDEAWGSPGYERELVEQSALVAAERKLGCALPRSFRSAILDYGLPSVTIELLSTICDREVDVPDVSEFHSPKEIATSTIDWRELGMPRHLIAFASDGSGNQFAFSTKPTQQIDEVWFWDHDFEDCDLIANSFENWLQLYVDLKG